MSALPALMLPYGEQDHKDGSRLKFLLSCAPILNRLGWTWGIEGKGLLGDWARDCFPEITAFGGRITFHPPAGIAKGLGDPSQPIPDKLLAQAELVPEFMEEQELEAYTIHLAPAISIDPPEDMGLERYNSPIGAEEMLIHIQRQVDPLKKLKEMMGGILHIENVDITNFRDGGYRTPTFLSLQTGCWLDLVWLKELTGVQTTVDTEHHFCARNLLTRQEDLAGLSRWSLSTHGAGTPLAKITGYWLEIGYPPAAETVVRWDHFINILASNLFHLGGAYRAVDEGGRIDTHLPIDVRDLRQKNILDYQLRLIMNGQGIGAVIEVCGKIAPDKYSEWSPRPHDDEVAKMETYLTVVNEIEELQKI